MVPSLHIELVKEPVRLWVWALWRNSTPPLGPRKEDCQAGHQEQSPVAGGGAAGQREKASAPAEAPPRAGAMDALVRLLQLLVLLLTLPLHLLALLGCWQPLCKSFFPYLMAALTASSNRRMESKKRELFSQIKGLMGTSGKVALLELGSGTGANFQFYPPGCRITCLDPNPHFEKFLTKSMAENRHLQYERFVVAPGEDMKQLADGSMDVVVCTLVLCSVQSPKRVLKEVRRVLRPGGVLFFWEHVAEPQGSWAFTWQQAIEPTWKHITDGCCLTRETWKDLENAQFSEVQMEQQPPPFKWLPVGPHIMGKAVK